MKLIMTFIMSCIIISSLSAVTLSGNVADAMTGEDLIGANVSVYKDGILQTGTSTNIDGEYHFKHLDPGNYDVEFSYIGYEPIIIEGVFLKASEEKELLAELNQGLVLTEVVITEYKVSLISQSVICCGGCGRICRENVREDEKLVVKEDEEVITEALSISYYPNPTTDLLNIVLAKASESLIVRSMDGKELLRRANLSEEIVVLNVSNYAAGTYILQVLNEGEMITKKFIVSRL